MVAESTETTVRPQTATALARSPSARAWAGRCTLAVIATRALWIALLWLHGYLLWERITDLTLFEPQVALRWGIAALMIATLIRLQYLGVPLFRGRRALIFWLVILLLHAGSATAAGSRLQVVADSGLLIAVSLWFLALELLGERTRAVALVLRRTWTPRLAPARLPCAPGSLDPLSPRPPPFL